MARRTKRRKRTPMAQKVFYVIAIIVALSMVLFAVAPAFVR